MFLCFCVYVCVGLCACVLKNMLALIEYACQFVCGFDQLNLRLVCVFECVCVCDQTISRCVCICV